MTTLEKLNKRDAYKTMVYQLNLAHTHLMIAMDAAYPDENRQRISRAVSTVENDIKWFQICADALWDDICND